MNGDDDRKQPGVRGTAMSDEISAIVTSEDVRAAAAVVENMRDIYLRAVDEEQMARKQATEAVNALNAATKKFDELLSEFRRTVPIGATWRQPETMGKKG